MPDRLHSYNLLNRNPLERIFADGFLDVVDPRVPLSLFREAYNNADAGSMLNRMLALDLQFTLANNDLYKVNTMCDMAGVRVAYPLLSEELVNFSARLPSSLKVKGLKLRYFFKEALKDFLPPEIIRKKKHGFGLPVGIWMQKHKPLSELAYDTLQAFKARKILRPEFIDQLVENHRSGFAAHYGGEIWSLMVLELWFQAHRHTMNAVPR
jgi:asparagine synthase (glutamine-hydrolysing)